MNGRFAPAAVLQIKGYGTLIAQMSRNRHPNALFAIELPL
jgi:hypothetical protein